MTYKNPLLHRWITTKYVKTKGTLHEFLFNTSLSILGEVSF